MKTVIRGTRTTNLIRCWRLQIATQQGMTLVVCNKFGQGILVPAPGPRLPFSQEKILAAGRALTDVAGYKELNDAMIEDP